MGYTYENTEYQARETKTDLNTQFDACHQVSKTQLLNKQTLIQRAQNQGTKYSSDRELQMSKHLSFSP